MFHITELPKEIHDELLEKNDTKVMQYSENMIVYTGRQALHIFDIDRERWVFNSTAIGHQYNNIAENAR